MSSNWDIVPILGEDDEKLNRQYRYARFHIKVGNGLYKEIRFSVDNEYMWVTQYMIAKIKHEKIIQLADDMVLARMKFLMSIYKGYEKSRGQFGVDIALELIKEFISDQGNLQEFEYQNFSGIYKWSDPKQFDERPQQRMVTTTRREMLQDNRTPGYDWLFSNHVHDSEPCQPLESKHRARQQRITFGADIPKPEGWDYDSYRDEYFRGLGGRKPIEESKPSPNEKMVCFLGIISMTEFREFRLRYTPEMMNIDIPEYPILVDELIDMIRTHKESGFYTLNWSIVKTGININSAKYLYALFKKGTEAVIRFEEENMNETYTHWSRPKPLVKFFHFFNKTIHYETDVPIPDPPEPSNPFTGQTGVDFMNLLREIGVAQAEANNGPVFTSRPLTEEDLFSTQGAEGSEETEIQEEPEAAEGAETENGEPEVRQVKTPISYAEAVQKNKTESKTNSNENSRRNSTEIVSINTGATVQPQNSVDEEKRDSGNGTVQTKVVKPTKLENKNGPTNLDNEIQPNNLENENEPTNLEDGTEPTNLENENGLTNLENEDGPTNLEKENEPTNLEDGNEPTKLEPTISEDGNEPTSLENENEPTNLEDGNEPTNLKPTILEVESQSPLRATNPSLVNNAQATSTAPVQKPNQGSQGGQRSANQHKKNNQKNQKGNNKKQSVSPNGPGSKNNKNKNNKSNGTGPTSSQSSPLVVDSQDAETIDLLNSLTSNERTAIKQLVDMVGLDTANGVKTGNTSSEDQKGKNTQSPISQELEPPKETKTAIKKAKKAQAKALLEQQKAASADAAAPDMPKKLVMSANDNSFVEAEFDVQVDPPMSKGQKKRAKRAAAKAKNSTTVQANFADDLATVFVNSVLQDTNNLFKSEQPCASNTQNKTPTPTPPGEQDTYIPGQVVTHDYRPGVGIHNGTDDAAETKPVTDQSKKTTESKGCSAGDDDDEDLYGPPPSYERENTVQKEDRFDFPQRVSAPKMMEIFRKLKCLADQRGNGSLRNMDPSRHALLNKRLNRFLQVHLIRMRVAKSIMFAMNMALEPEAMVLRGVARFLDVDIGASKDSKHGRRMDEISAMNQFAKMSELDILMKGLRHLDKRTAELKESCEIGRLYSEVTEKLFKMMREQEVVYNIVASSTNVRAY